MERQGNPGPPRRDQFTTFEIRLSLDKRTGHCVIEAENDGIPATHALFILEEYVKRYREKLSAQEREGGLSFYSL